MPTPPDALQAASDIDRYELVRSARRRTLAIEVHRDLRVVVRAPAAMSARVIAERVAGRRAWIGRTLARLQANPQASRAPPGYVTGEWHDVLGESCRLEVTRGARSAVVHAPGLIHVVLRGEPSPARTRRALEAWRRERGRAVAAAYIGAHFDFFRARGHAVPEVSLRPMRSRWGSLIARRRMTLNLALMAAPPECFEYVVVHELCHLEHAGHGRDFYRLLERLMPDWRERRRRLDRVALAGS